MAKPASGTAAASNSVTSGLIHFWPLNEGTGTSAADIVGSANAAFHGTVAWGSNADGAKLTFGGAITDYIEPGSLPSDITALNDFTLAAWITYVDNGARNDIAGQWGAGAGDEHMLLSAGISTADAPIIYVQSGAGAFSNAEGTAMTGGTRYFLAARYDHTALQLCVGGSQVATQSFSATLLNSATAPFRIGGSPSNLGACDIEMVALWNRRLDNTEMSTLASDPFGTLFASGSGVARRRTYGLLSRLTRQPFGL